MERKAISVQGNGQILLRTKYRRETNALPLTKSLAIWWLDGSTINYLQIQAMVRARQATIDFEL